jgi:GT2 family glycosyltransferase
MDLLMRCLDSIATQDFPAADYEVIVCDDGSTVDLSKTVARFYPRLPNLKLVKQGRRGPAAARNLGICESDAPIIMFLDSDCVADNGLIRCLVGALADHPHWAGAEACLLPVEGFPGPLWEAPGAPEGGRFHTAAIAYRRDALIAVGGLDETFLLPACEDVELAARILSLGLIGFVPDAKAYHPRRRVSFHTHWRSRLYWKYLVILAQRYGFLAFPDRKTGRFFRLRLAWAAVFSLPLGRLLKSLHWMRQSPSDAILGSLYAFFDIPCGLGALPDILFGAVPERINYLRTRTIHDVQAAKVMQWECRP